MSVHMNPIHLVKQLAADIHDKFTDTLSLSSSSDAKLILSVNSGSSSLKISLYALTSSHTTSEQDASSTMGTSVKEPVTEILTSSISGLSSPPAKFSFSITASRLATDATSHSGVASQAKEVKDESTDTITDHASAFAHFLDYLKREASIDRDRIEHVCHRVVHGGDYTDPVIISEESYHHIEKLSDLAPLHNGAALSVIKACIAELPKANSIAYFDTAFHRSIPEHISSYAIDPKIAKAKGLKKYGFHGLSYSFILRSVARHLQKPPTSLNIIILHLGSGASACAIKNGQSLDTSMGLTPLDGLPGATRSGSIDPSLIFHFTNNAGSMSHDSKATVDLGVTEAEKILNKESGWKALTGTTDFGSIVTKADLTTASVSSNPSRLAFDLFTDRLYNFIGSYYLKLDGKVDALVFSGGIGEKSQELRAAVGRKVACLEFEAVDERVNWKVGSGKEEAVVLDLGAEGAEGREKRIMVCKTDEQLEMARQCALHKKHWV